MTIRSSWNCDRVATCCVKKAPTVRVARPQYLVAQYRGDEVSVCGARGKKHFTLRVDSKIVSASVKNGVLSVSTERGGLYTYGAKTGACLSQMRPIVDTVATTESSVAA